METTDTDPRITAVLELVRRELRRYMNTSVGAYVRNQRLVRAEVLLSGGQLTVKEVASEVGFSNAQHFARIFNQHFWNVPTSIKTQQKQALNKD